MKYFTDVMTVSILSNCAYVLGLSEVFYIDMFWTYEICMLSQENNKMSCSFHKYNKMILISAWNAMGIEYWKVDITNSLETENTVFLIQEVNKMMIFAWSF